MRSPMILAILVLSAACSKPAEPPVQTKLTPEQFVDVFVQLRNAQTRSVGAQEYEQAKQAILRKAAVTEEDLRAFVKAHAREISVMATVWDSVQSRISRGDTIVQ